ncbi:MAG: hypothetical protein H6635_14680 [Anaerolineales bacterium]|nr:hypothetical protein [Anaerolineales bacterium]MCB9146608.1 hypothetical protein [Anaerolineales bacterium]
MTIEYDEKGKYYTDIISKTPIPSAIQTATHLIRGTIHVRREWRIKDELESEGAFIAVTNAEVFSSDGSILYQPPFLAIRKDQIIWIIPTEDENEQGGE